MRRDGTVSRTAEAVTMEGANGLRRVFLHSGADVTGVRVTRPSGVTTTPAHFGMIVREKAFLLQTLCPAHHPSHTSSCSLCLRWRWRWRCVRPCLCGRCREMSVCQVNVTLTRTGHVLNLPSRFVRFSSCSLDDDPVLERRDTAARSKRSHIRESCR